MINEIKLNDNNLEVPEKLKDICNLRDSILEKYQQLKKIDSSIEDDFQSLQDDEFTHCYKFFKVEVTDRGCDLTPQKMTDRIFWRYFVHQFKLKNYMLCTEYDKFNKEIEEFKTPDFTIENTYTFVANLKTMIYNNMEKLVKEVFEEVTTGTYTPGNHWKTPTKKRNNNGIDKMFILRTYDNSRMRYWNGKVSITDDLEKVCYLINSQTLPDTHMIDHMRKEKITEHDNGYLKIKVCQNGNTHYWIEKKTRDKLNLYGSGFGKIGEDIRIKIFEKD